MQKIYLDHNATSPSSSEHLDFLFSTLKECSGNPSSPHAQGRAASVAMTKARHSVAKSLGVGVSDLVFTSGGTESNHMGTVGVLRYKMKMDPLVKPGDDKAAQHAIISSIEHPAVYNHLEYLQKTEGLKLTVVPVDENGVVSFDHVISAITKETTLISIMAANNEVGSLQPVKEIGDFLNHKRWGENTEDSTHFQNIHFHVDAVQAFGKIPHEKWLSLGVDSAALSAHKLGALQGVGALFLRKGRKFLPSMMGGAQEKNRRAGTENLPGIVSFGHICEQTILSPSCDWWDKVAQMDARRIRLYHAIKELPHVVMNSSLLDCIPNTINFSVCSDLSSSRGLTAGSSAVCLDPVVKPRGDMLTSRGDMVTGEDLLLMLDMKGIYASSGSACSSGANLASKVLIAMNRSPSLAKNAIRLSLSVHTTDAEIDFTIACLKKFLQS
jgi:cysteine desulfurase